jgi:hypothetical protein
VPFLRYHQKAISQHHNSILYADIDDHGVHWSNKGQILEQCQWQSRSREALDLPYWVMCSASHWRIVMAVKMPPKGGAFVRFRRLFCLTNLIVSI